jgi:hypothetical protein
VITPRLLRRALRRAAQWRLLLLWWAALLLPKLLLVAPWFAFFERHLGRSTRAKAVLARLDGETFLELRRLLVENGTPQALWQGAIAALLVLVFSAPIAAAATVAAAQAEGPVRMRALLTGAGSLYGRMLRISISAVLPLGLAAGLGALAFRFAMRANETATRETAADRNLLLALLVTLCLVFVAHLVVEAARAQFAVEPARRSALLALLNGARVCLRRFPRALGIGAAGLLAALLPAAACMAVRLQIDQRNAALVAVAWILGEAAQVAVGYGRNVRLFALAELTSADAAARSRTAVSLVPAVFVAPSSAGEAEGAAPLSKGHGPAI